MTSKVNTKDAAELKARIAELTAKLNAQRNALKKQSALAKATAARIHKLAAWRAARKIQLAKLAKGPKRALTEGMRFVGQTEKPAGSNKGPGIVSLCQKELIGYDGVAWCGCFGAYLLRHFGGVKVTTRMAYCPYNVTDAISAQSSGKVVNGWKGTRDKNRGRPGDCAMMDWQHDGVADHFVIIVENLGNGAYKTLEGNTSFDSAGSQSNGGCVAIKTRYAADIAAICIPAYA